MFGTTLTILLTIAFPALVAWALWKLESSRSTIFWTSMCTLVFSSAMVWAIVDDVHPFDPIEPCNMALNSEQYAHALRRLADLKEVCGHMEDPERFDACTHNPQLPMYYHGYCHSIGYTAEELNGWVGSRVSDLYLACSQQGPCMHWAETAKGWDGSPILE